MKKILIILLMFSSVVLARTISISIPNGGENWEQNSFKYIHWSTTGLTNNVKITLWRNNQLLGLIIKDLHPSQSNYKWQVGKFQGGIAAAGGGYKVKIREQGGVDFTTFDDSGNFSIYAALSQKPDLVINGKMTRTPKHPGEGEIFKFKFCVANSGRGVANVSTAKLTITGPNSFFQQKSVNIRKLAGGVGDHQYISKNFRFSNMGIYKFKVKLDTGDSIDESDEGNNEKFILIDINPRADLIVCLDQNKRVQVTSGKLSIHAYIKNIGNFKSKPCVLRFYVKKHGGKNFNIPSLKPNGEYKVTRRHRWLTKGHKKITAKIDSTNLVIESKERNNSVESSIYVRGPFEDKYVVSKPKVCSETN